MKLGILGESDRNIKRLERLWKDNKDDPDLRMQIFKAGLRGQLHPKDLYNTPTTGGTVGSGPQKIRNLRSINREWELIYQGKPTDGNFFQESGKFLGTLEDAQEYADQEIMRRFKRFDPDLNRAADTVLGPWAFNPNYGGLLVYSRGYGHNKDAAYLQAYVGVTETENEPTHYTADTLRTTCSHCNEPAAIDYEDESLCDAHFAAFLETHQ